MRYAQIPTVPLPLPTTTNTTAPGPETTIPPDTTPPAPPPDTTPLSTPEPAVELPPPTFVPAVPAVPAPTTTSTTTGAVLLPDNTGRVADALPPAYAVGAGTVLAVAAVLTALATRARPGGTSMLDPRRRWRLLTGAGCILLAAIVGLVGWLKLSDEPAVNRQIPYLASAGMALVVLAAVGGSLLVADQLRSDSERIDELEDALGRLTATLEPIVESAPRRK